MTKFGTAVAIAALSFVFLGSDRTTASASSVCRNLNAELASLSRSRSGNTSKYARAATKQRNALGKTMNMARRAGCVGLLRSRNNAEQCQALNATIQKMRANLRTLEARAGGRNTSSRAAKIRRDMARYQCNGDKRRVREVRKNRSNRDGANLRTRIASLQNDQLPAVRNNGQPQINANSPVRVVPQNPGYRTVCVRLCDGYFFPVSFSTTKKRFRQDARACQQLAGATETELYVFKLPAQTLEDGRSLKGKRYTSLKNAFRYQREFVNGCSFAPVDENYIRTVLEKKKKERQHPEMVPSIVRASLSNDEIIQRGLAAKTDGRILPGSEADRRQMTEEKLALLPEAKFGFRDVFQTPQVTETALASRYFLSHAKFPPVPFARPNPDENSADRKKRLAELDRLAAEEAALIGKGKYVVNSDRFPPVPLSRPGAEGVVASITSEGLDLIADKSDPTTDITEVSADPIVTNAVRYAIPHDMFPPVPLKRPGPAAVVRTFSSQSWEEAGQSLDRTPRL